MKQIRSVVFFNTNPKHERIAVLKNNDSCSQLDDDDTNVFLIDRYQHRSQQLSSMCLAEFATYVTNYRPDDSVCDTSPDLERDTTSTEITLIDGFGKMN